MYSPPEEYVALGVNSRQNARNMLFQSLMASTDEEITKYLDKHHISLAIGTSRLVMCSFVVDAEYPDISQPMQAPVKNAQETLNEHRKLVSEASSFMQVQPGDPQLYSDMVDPEHRLDVPPATEPQDWIHVSYVQEMLVELNLATLSGEPDNVLDVINKYVREQGWAGAHEEVVADRMAADAPVQSAPADAVTEQIDLLAMREPTVYTRTIPDSIRIQSAP